MIGPLTAKLAIREIVEAVDLFWEPDFGRFLVRLGRDRIDAAAGETPFARAFTAWAREYYRPKVRP